MLMKRELAGLKPHSNSILKGLENKHTCAAFFTVWLRACAVSDASLLGEHPKLLSKFRQLPFLKVKLRLAP